MLTVGRGQVELEFWLNLVVRTPVKHSHVLKSVPPRTGSDETKGRTAHMKFMLTLVLSVSGIFLVLLVLFMCRKKQTRYITGDN